MRLLAGHNLPSVGGQIVPGHGLGRFVASVRAFVTGLTINPTYGPAPQVGSVVTGALGVLQGGEVVVHRWLLNGVAISGANLATYTPLAAQDNGSLRYSPTVNGIPVNSPPYVIRLAPPVAGSPDPLSLTRQVGILTINLQALFVGTDPGAYASDVPWLTVDGSNGFLDIDQLLEASATITKTNSGGSASVQLGVTISAPAAAPFSVLQDGSDVIISGVQDISHQAITVEQVGADIVITLLEPVIMPLPKTAVIYAAADVANDLPIAGRLPIQSLALPDPVGTTITLPGTTLTAADFLYLLGEGDQIEVDQDSLTVVPVAPLVMSVLLEGNSINMVENFAARTAAANFAASFGTITGTTVTAFGDAQSVGEALEEGNVVGYRVTAQHSSGQSFVFESNTTAVQYSTRGLVTAGNKIKIDVNPLMPVDRNISVAITGTDLDGTYVIPAGSFLQLRPFHFPGTTRVSHAGTVAQLTAGVLMTGNPGLFSTSTDDVTITFQHLRNGAPIAGATSRTYALVEADRGAAYSFRVTANDGVNPATVVTTAPINIPAAQAVLAPQRIFNPAVVTNNVGAHTFAAADLSAVPANTPLYIAVTARDSTADFSILSVTVGGAAATLVSVSDALSARIIAGFWKIPRPAAATVDIVATFSEPVNTGVKVTVFAVPGASSELVVRTALQNGPGLPVSIDLNTQANGALLAAYVDEAGGALTWTGAGNVSTLQDESARNHSTASAAITTGQTPRPVSVASAINTQKAAAAISII